jgi:3-oxoacyl-[acyl-carrier protein] reductase
MNTEQTPFSLPGLPAKVAVVTGGALGIGKVISKTLGAFGVRIAIIDITAKSGNKTAAEIKEAGGQAMYCHGNVADADDITTCLQTVAGQMGGIDILVNNAGVSKNIPFADLTLAEWNRVIEINLTGAFVCTQIAVPYMLKRGSGNIIMISSGSALTGSGGGAHYAASKGGLNSLVRAISRELAPKGIRVNAVAPRTIESELLSLLYSQDELLRLIKDIPIGRLGRNEDVANIVAFLASDLSAFITGETILADGGRTFS